MAGKLRFVQVGVGGFGRRWVDALAAASGAQVVGLVDPNPAAMAAASEKLPVPAKAQFATLADAMSLKFDAAVVCVPPPARMPIYETLAAAGKHILAEKPLADSMADAAAAVALKARHGIHFVISQNYRYSAVMQTLRKVLAEQRYGAPGACQVDFFRYPRFRGFREEMAFPLIIDMAIHHFDLARFLLGADPISVVGKSWNGAWSVMKGDSASTLVFELSGGVHFAYNSSWTSLRPPDWQTDWNGTWVIECSKGCVVMKDSKIQAWPWRLDDKGQPTWGTGETIDVGEFAGGQAYVLEQFVAELRGGPPAPTSVEDNIKSIAMVFAAVEAFRTRGNVSVAAMAAPQEKA
jgi:predicted dehydrogenase